MPNMCTGARTRPRGAGHCFSKTSPKGRTPAPKRGTRALKGGPQPHSTGVLHPGRAEGPQGTLGSPQLGSARCEEVSGGSLPGPVPVPPRRSAHLCGCCRAVLPHRPARAPVPSRGGSAASRAASPRSCPRRRHRGNHPAAPRPSSPGTGRDRAEDEPQPLPPETGPSPSPGQTRSPPPPFCPAPPRRRHQRPLAARRGAG